MFYKNCLVKPIKSLNWAPPCGNNWWWGAKSAHSHINVTILARFLFLVQLRIYYQCHIKANAGINWARFMNDIVVLRQKKHFDFVFP